MSTPDTEWEKEFEAEFMEYAAENENTLIDSDTDGKRVKQFIRPLLTSRDTHWKEREKEVLKSIIRVAKDPDAVDRIASLRLRELLDLDNLK